MDLSTLTVLVASKQKAAGRVGAKLGERRVLAQLSSTHEHVASSEPASQFEKQVKSEIFQGSPKGMLQSPEHPPPLLSMSSMRPLS